MKYDLTTLQLIEVVALIGVTLPALLFVCWTLLLLAYSHPPTKKTLMDRFAAKLVRHTTLNMYKQILGPWRFLQGFWWRTVLGLPPAPRVKLLPYSTARESLLACYSLDSKRKATFTQAIINKFRTDFGRPYSDMAKEYEAADIHGKAMRGVAGSELSGAQLRRAYALVNQGRGQTILAWLAISDWFRLIALYRDVPEFLKVSRAYKVFGETEGITPERLEREIGRIKEQLKIAGIEMPRYEVSELHNKWKLDPHHAACIFEVPDFGDTEAYDSQVRDCLQTRTRTFPLTTNTVIVSTEDPDFSQMERRFFRESE